MEIRPAWPAEWGDTLTSLPVFLPGIQLSVNAQRNERHWSVNLLVKRIEREPLILNRLVSRLPPNLDPAIARLELSGLDGCSISVETGGRIIVTGPITLAQEGDTIGITTR
jgi:hypothetical protein